MRDHGAGHEDHPADVEVVDVGEVSGGDFLSGADHFAAGVVDEDVDVGAEVGEGGGYDLRGG